MLREAWRETASPPNLDAAELQELAPFLIGSGVGALVWWHLRDTASRSHPAALELQQAYRLQTLQAAMREMELKRLFTSLHSIGVEPVLIKGWVNARRYAEKGLRPYGDIDLCILPAQYEAARQHIQQGVWGDAIVELHPGFTDLNDSHDLGAEQLMARTSQVELDGLKVRILAPEDHLRLLCIHFLRHGAWRPLWLCDIALAVETRSPDFDWQRCLGEDQRRAYWVIGAIGLAHHLLGLKTTNLPFRDKTEALPRWLVPSVLHAWAKPRIEDHPRNARMTRALRQPIKLPQAFSRRWPNAVEAVIGINASLNEVPPFCYQLSYCLWRTGEFLRGRANDHP